MCEHKLYFIESSKLTYKGIEYSIDKYQCKYCEGWKFYDKNTKQAVSFDGGIGVEI